MPSFVCNLNYNKHINKQTRSSKLDTIDNIMALAYKLRDARTYEWDVSEAVEADRALRTALTELAANATEYQQAADKMAMDLIPDRIIKVDQFLFATTVVAPDVPTDAERLNGLEELCGCWQDGTDKTLKLFQDASTKTWILKINDDCYYGDTFNKVIDAAIGGAND